MKKLPIKSYLIIAFMVMLPISVAADELPDAFTMSWLEYRSNHPELFKLDEMKCPVAVAGVPPDYFSETGQLWGNPL